MEKNEDIFTALKREILEELGCEIETNEILLDHTHEHEHFIIHLFSIKCRITKGCPIAKEHSKLLWLKRNGLLSLKWAPADITIVEKLLVQ